ncbi:uncharacterized protein (TIGR02284 family) [Flavobacterium sp. 103]|jgi:uncharacterized protein (TIGR02284 family)|uniref:PA2169 family four-helix-bundle protein n=1 Tax=Flavobacterium sp. 103 TaxID=2135624 RepID=UPI000D5EFB5A|nr:PA2169 family four-helix-bundle protein [Flavobacterium sp. 103]PVX47863.1 uncharacterized protein (TIGR02284 family) [Flavobacterium sp. 103]
MNKKKSIDALNAFIGINKNRFESYIMASKQINEYDLITLFTGFQEKNKQYKAELVSEILKLGGKPTMESPIILLVSKIYREVRSKFRIKDREDILNRCEYDADVTLKKYTTVLNNNIEHLSPKHQNIINAQHQSIKKDHDTLKGLGDLMVTCRRFNLETQT